MAESQGEYGVLSDKQVEILCSHSSVESLHIVNTALGGEAATKDPTLFQKEGIEQVFQLLESSNKVLENQEEDIRLFKAIDQRRKTAGLSIDTETAERWYSQNWTEEEINALEAALYRYPPGQTYSHINLTRWQLITNYVNSSLSPSTGLFTEDDILRSVFMLQRNINRECHFSSF